ncbi:MAG: sensor domain-containing diguanylate cyclase/phosphohydrolase [Dehalococcoidia bacterium]
MRSLPNLAALATLTTSGVATDEAAERVLAIVRDALGASAAFFVYGEAGRFQHVGAAPGSELSDLALWLIHRDLTSGGAPCGFTVRQGRVERCTGLDAVRRCEYVAALLPSAGGAGEMLLARGPWPRGISGARRTFLEIAVPLLARFVERRYGLARAERDRHELSALTDISRVMFEAEDLEAALCTIADTAARITGVDHVSIDLVDDAGAVTVRCFNGSRRPAGQPSTWLAARSKPDPVRDAVLRTRQPMLFADAQGDERIPLPGRRYFARLLIRSTAMFPLRWRDGALGVLSIASRRPLAFTAAEIELLEGLAAQVASTVSGVRLYQALQVSEARLRTVVANAPVVLFALDAAGVFTLSEGKGLASLGLRPGEVVGRSVFDVYRDAPRVIENIRRALSGDAFTAPTEVADIVFDTYYAPVRDREGAVTGIVGVATDVTERRQAETMLREQARRDPLTGVLNHAGITDVLRGLVSGEPSPLVVAVTDVDGLKAVNDTYGHPAGDAALRAVAQALERDGALVGRYGGDEFVSVLAGADRRTGERYRDAVVAALRDARLLDPETGARIPVVASVGIAEYPAEAETLDALVQLADGAMYTAKRQRQAAPGELSLSSSRSSERAARMVGEIVPLLTSHGSLDEKLRLVSHRLSVGAGYDAVHFEAFTEPGAPPVASNTFALLPDALLGAWNREQRAIASHPVGELLRRTRRPLVLDDPQHDERLTVGQRQILTAAAIRSAVVVPMLWQDEMVGLLAVGSKRDAAFTSIDIQFLTAVASQVTAIVRMATLVDDLQLASTRLTQSQTETVIMLAAAAEAHDQSTGRHLQRVRALTTSLAHELGFSASDADELGLAGVLHDIGKIRVPDAILISPSQLSDVEWALMKQHTVWGAEFLGSRPGFALAATVARSHHERWDGSGYPAGLAGEDIPLAATIVSVADALDAMTNNRPYRAGRSTEWAVAEIQAAAGTQFSPRVVAALEAIYLRGELPLLPRPEEDLAEAA